MSDGNKEAAEVSVELCPTVCCDDNASDICAGTRCVDACAGISRKYESSVDGGVMTEGVA